MTRVNGTDRVLTGWGRTAPRRAYVAGPMETSQLQEIIAAQPARGVLARGAGRSYGDAGQNAGGYILAPVTARAWKSTPNGAEHLITEVLSTLRRHHAATFLGTLKRFGPASGNYLSFPGPGWSLAVDMPTGNPRLRMVLNHLDRRVADAGGRVYLAKDVRMRADAFAAMYSSLAEWRDVRDLLDPRKVFSSDLGRRLGLC